MTFETLSVSDIDVVKEKCVLIIAGLAQTLLLKLAQANTDCFIYYNVWHNLFIRLINILVTVKTIQISSPLKSYKSSENK